MRNLIKVETKAALNTEALEAIEKEITTLTGNIRIDVRSAAQARLNKILNNCVNAAYKLGKIDAQKGN